MIRLHWTDRVFGRWLFTFSIGMWIVPFLMVPLTGQFPTFMVVWACLGVTLFALGLRSRHRIKVRLPQILAAIDERSGDGSIKQVTVSELEELNAALPLGGRIHPL